MSLEDLGNIGELVAAVAVVVSLIYLAVQIRQNTNSLRASTFQDIVREGNVFVRDLALHPDLARIWRLGSASLEAMSPEERERFHFLILSFYRRVENTYHQRRRRLIDEEEPRAYWQAHSTCWLAQVRVHGGNPTRFDSARRCRSTWARGSLRAPLSSQLKLTANSPARAW